MVFCLLAFNTEVDKDLVNMEMKRQMHTCITHLAFVIKIDLQTNVFPKF